MREMLLTHKDLLLEMEEIRKKVTGQDEKIDLIFNYLKQFIKDQEEPRKAIGYKTHSKKGDWLYTIQSINIIQKNNKQELGVSDLPATVENKHYGRKSGVPPSVVSKQVAKLMQPIFRSVYF